MRKRRDPLFCFYYIIIMKAIDFYKIGRLLQKQEEESIFADFIQNVLNGRMKDTIPFSTRLNQFIRGWYEDHENIIEFTNIDNFDPDDLKGTFLEHKDYFKETGKLRIWKGASNNTIFGSPTVNWYFRAWHDHVHITNDLGYSPIEESIVAEIQKSQLPKDWIIERELIDIEVTGQVQYHHLHGNFVKDQRQFTAIYYQDPMTALKQKEL